MVALEINMFDNQAPTSAKFELLLFAFCLNFSLALYSLRLANSLSQRIRLWILKILPNISLEKCQDKSVNRRCRGLV